MMQQALHSAQARLDKLQTAYDEAFSALEANPSSGLKRERFEELKISLHKAEDSVNSLATTASTSGISGATASVDDSIGVMQALFAPFSETAFPKSLNATSLAGLMAAPLACRVPLPQSQYQHAKRLFPDLFCPETTISAHDLHPFLVTALQTSWPTGTPTELLLTPFWDTVGYKMPEFAAGHLGMAVSQNRNSVDDSITIADKKRDYMQFLDNILVIGGEDKPVRSEMRVAQSELFLKHKGANAALYGDLGYIIMIATAGECISVFALDVRQGAQLQPLVEQFEMRTLSGRRKVLQLFINLTRWLHTVHSLDLLPPPPPARLMKAFFRPSPYHVNSNEEQYGQVQLLLHFNSVEKTFQVPGRHMQELLDVYGLLQKLRHPGTIRCASLHVNDVKQHMKHPMDSITQQISNSTSLVHLRLHPVGARINLKNNQQLCNLVNSLLATLAPVHAAGFVHRDIRLDNVVKGPDGWVLLDWELAGRENQRVWWTGQSLPPAIRAGFELYTCQTDLWQIGQLVLTHAIPSVGSAAYAHQLMSGQVTSAALAPTAEWND
ncbi:TPA: hypothetical protein ACH3X1_001664 [Trebouxia sp. C0004]